MRSGIVGLALLAGLPAVAIVGCSTAPQSASGQQDLSSSAQAALQDAIRRDPTLKQTLDTSAGYAVFPTVGEGGFIVGGGYGKGVLYERGQPAGYCDISSLSAGAKIGGQESTQIIVFQNDRPLANFKNGTFAFGAEAKAVAVKEGAAAATEFKDGVAVFVYDQSGLMADASLGGQTFRYTPMSAAQQAAGHVEGQSDTIDATKHQQNLNRSNPDGDVNVEVKPNY